MVLEAEPRCRGTMRRARSSTLRPCAHPRDRGAPDLVDFGDPAGGAGPPGAGVTVLSSRFALSSPSGSVSARALMVRLTRFGEPSLPATNDSAPPANGGTIGRIRVTAIGASACGVSSETIHELSTLVSRAALVRTDAISAAHSPDGRGSRLVRERNTSDARIALAGGVPASDLVLRRAAAA